jgi:hypothetical protein
MSAAQHTPGPWIAVEKFGFIGSIQGGVIREYANGTSQDQLFMVCCVQDDNGGRTATNANARLIAAAPDLLEVLKEIVGFWDSIVPIDCVNDCVNDLHVKARAAIAKAEGGAA